jgi:hypothetical protein
VTLDFHNSSPFLSNLTGLLKNPPGLSRPCAELKRWASRKQERISKKSLEAAQYFFLWTSLQPSSWGCHEVLELYRSRWQIELAFKRMKSIMGLGHLPKKDPESCRAWLHGKLLTSLLVEALMGAAKTLSPWGYELV